MNREDKKLINEMMDSLCHCIDLLNLLTDEQDLNKNISVYIGPLMLIKRELSNNLCDMQRLLSDDS